MDAELVFKIVNLAILPAWGLLIFFPKGKVTQYVVYSHAYPYFLGLLYGYLMFTAFSLPGDAITLASIRDAFNSDEVLLAGWIHYLIFDLFVGSWEVLDAGKNRINHLKIIPCLVFTFLLGPIGLLIYLVMRQYEKRNFVRG